MERAQMPAPSDGFRGSSGKYQAHLQDCITRLEQFAAQRGMPVIRDALTEPVFGRIEPHRIVLRQDMTAEQQILTLIHELTHLIVHCNLNPRLDRTVCEYEAEAVERLVGAELGIATHSDGLDDDIATVTDGLWASSIERIHCATSVLVCAAYGQLLSQGLESDQLTVANPGPRITP